MQNWATIINNLMPHGYCLSWQPRLLWLHGVSDLVTAVAYYSIPVMLLLFVRRRQDLQFSWIFVLFGVFIMACGATHVMSLWTLWYPDYLAAGMVKALTALVSIATAGALLPLLPKALALPGPAQWEAVHRELRDEIAERSEAEAEIRRLNTLLEQRVAERTAALESANRDLRASETRMRESREFLQAIVDNSGAVMFVKDIEGRYLLVNRRYAELFHVNQEEVLGRTDHDVFPAAMADAFRDADRRIMAAGTALQVEEVAPHDDGPHTYLSIKFPLRDAAGKLYAVGGIATDITDRKQAEERFRRVVEAAPSAMLLVGRDGRIALANAQSEKVFGYTREELLGQPIELLVPRRIQAGHPARRDAYLAQPSARRMGGERELHGLHKDGREIPVEIGLNPVETPEGMMILASVIDISERKQAEADRQARQVAEGASRAKSEFLSAMSHELRTPLNAILGYAQLLRHDASLSPQQTSGLATIQQSGQHLLMLINDLLDLAKIEAGKFDLAPMPANPAALLAVVADIIRVKAEEKSLLFSYRAADLPSGVLADEKRLRQVLLNLLGNAVKFTDRGQVSLQVSVLSQDAQAVDLRFEVIDSGIGMAPDQLETIFQPFEQVGDAHRRAGGTGLGLAISRQLIHLMGSDILVESHPGAGSRFWFDVRLPLSEAAAAATKVARSIAGYDGPRRKVLIADDVVGNRALLTDLLGGLGFILCEAENGAAAVAQAESQQPDLILMDLVMPVLDGTEAIRRIRAMPRLAKLPIIALSASANQADQAAARTAGADAFQTKPFDEESLLDAIGKALALTWIHAQPGTPPIADEADVPLVIPPAVELAALHDLALAGDMRGIRERAVALAAADSRYAGFAKRLNCLVRDFQSKALLQLITECLQKESIS